MINTMNVSLVRIAADRVRISIATIPDGCAVVSMRTNEVPTDGSEIPDPSGASWFVFELDLEDLGKSLCLGLSHVESAFFMGKATPTATRAKLRRGIAWSLAALFQLAREPG